VSAKPPFQAIFEVKIALESWISGIHSDPPFGYRRCRLDELWIRGTMPQPEPLKRRILVQI
jgi:hypothetical protein